MNEHPPHLSDFEELWKDLPKLREHAGIQVAGWVRFALTALSAARQKHQDSIRGYNKLLDEQKAEIEQLRRNYKSICVMLGWENTPPIDSIERQLRGERGLGKMQSEEITSLRNRIVSLRVETEQLKEKLQQLDEEICKSMHEFCDQRDANKADIAAKDAEIARLKQLAESRLHQRWDDNQEYRGEIERLRLYESEHERLKDELNQILHPDGGGPECPSFCDLVAYVRELQRLYELHRPKSIKEVLEETSKWRLTDEELKRLEE